MKTLYREKISTLIKPFKDFVIYSLKRVLKKVTKQDKNKNTLKMLLLLPLLLFAYIISIKNKMLLLS